MVDALDERQAIDIIAPRPELCFHSQKDAHPKNNLIPQTIEFLGRVGKI